MGILQTLDAKPGGWDLSAMRTMTVGGAAPPRAMIEAFGERHGLHITHGWGMTEMCPIGTISGAPGQERGLSGGAAYDKRAQQGPPIPFVEVRARGTDGLVPWDGASMGELEVRGPSISSSYFEAPDAADRWTDDGWFKTGDIVTIGPDGYVEVQDRAKDLVKSGGEWISTVALENALMGHAAVAEAAVDRGPRRQVVGAAARRRRAAARARRASDEELRDHLAPSFAKFWLPDRFEFVDEIPKTAVGKFRKTALREQFSTAAAVENAVGMGTFVSTERRDAVALVTIDNPPMNALATALLEELEAEVDALDADDDGPRDRPARRGRAGLRRGGRHQGVPVAPRERRGRRGRGRLGAGHPEAGAPDGRGPDAVRRRDPRLLPRRRARARDVLRRPDLRRRREARAAGDQARAHPRRRAARSGSRASSGTAARCSST